jgi:hypothetical protein
MGDYSYTYVEAARALARHKEDKILQMEEEPAPFRNLADCAIIGQRLDVRHIWDNNEYLGPDLEWVEKE